MTGRLAINPGPLKVVPDGMRGFGKSVPDPRCEEEVLNGSGRCLRDGVEEVGGRWLCRQHGKKARRE